jgi:excisionase family DNA binding protein
MSAETTELPTLFYTTTEAAAILRRSRRTVERMCRQGLLRRDPTCRKALIPKSEVENFVRRLTTGK